MYILPVIYKQVFRMLNVHILTCVGVAALDWYVMPLCGAVPWTCDRLSWYTTTERREKGEGGRVGRREGGREGGKEGGRVGRREGGWEGGREIYRRNRIIQ